MMTAQVSRDSRWTNIVVLLQRDWHFNLAYNSAKSTICIWTILSVGSGRSISGWLSKIALWLGPNDVIFISGMLPYMVIPLTFSYLVMKLLTHKLMLILPLSNDHYHIQGGHKIFLSIIYCPPYTTQWCKVKIMEQLIQLHVSTPWGHLQAYKIWYHTRYICCYYLQGPVVYSTLVIKM